MASTVAVPLIHKAKPIGVLNILSKSRDRYTERDATILGQFASHVASALVNARLFERERQDADAFEMLAEIGREVAAVLDLDQLLARIAQLTKRIVDYRTFGILLLQRVHTRTGDEGRPCSTARRRRLPKVALGEGLVGYAALHREAVLVPGRVQGPALHQGGGRRPVRAGDSHAAPGPLHRRVRPRESRARRVHASATWKS